MLSNPVIDTMLNRKSIRKYRDDAPSDEVIETIVRAGQQAPFAYQFCSLLLSRKRERKPFGAPLLFTICVDSHRFELIMARRNWRMAQNDLSLLLFGIQDAALMAENMVIAAESLGLARELLGGDPACRLYEMDATALGFPDGEFDVVICVQNGIASRRSLCRSAPKGRSSSPATRSASRPTASTGSAARPTRG